MLIAIPSEKHLVTQFLFKFAICRCKLDNCKSELFGTVITDRICVIVEDIPDQTWSEKRNCC